MITSYDITQSIQLGLDIIFSFGIMIIMALALCWTVIKLIRVINEDQHDDFCDWRDRGPGWEHPDNRYDDWE